jgi:hypothetical protein
MHSDIEMDPDAFALAVVQQYLQEHGYKQGAAAVFRLQCAYSVGHVGCNVANTDRATYPKAHAYEIYEVNSYRSWTAVLP